MGTRTYSRRASDGSRKPTALGIRTGRFLPASTGALEEFDKNDVRGTLSDGTAFRVVDNYIGKEVGDKLTVRLGNDTFFSYVREAGDVGVPLIELAEKIRTLAENPPPISASQYTTEDILRSYVQQSRDGMQVPTQATSDKEYIAELKEAANQPFEQLPLLPDVSGVDVTMRIFRNEIRPQFARLVEEVAASADSDEVKKAKIAYLTTQMVNMYERAVSASGRYAWKDILNQDKSVPIRVMPIRAGGRYILATPEENRANLMEGVRDISSLVNVEKKYDNAIVRQINALMKQRGYNITVG